MPHRTIVCRCEDLTLQDIRDIIADGVITLEEIKRLTRCGMGPCQGRTCRPLVVEELARATATPIAEVALPTFRPPTKPVKLGLFLGDDPADGPGDAPEGAPREALGDAPGGMMDGASDGGPDGGPDGASDGGPDGAPDGGYA